MKSRSGRAVAVPFDPSELNSRRRTLRDAVADIAEPVALQTMCAFLGWPDAMWTRVRDWILGNRDATFRQDREAIARYGIPVGVVLDASSVDLVNIRAFSLFRSSGRGSGAPGKTPKRYRDTCFGGPNVASSYDDDLPFTPAWAASMRPNWVTPRLPPSPITLQRTSFPLMRNPLFARSPTSASSCRATTATWARRTRSRICSWLVSPAAHAHSTRRRMKHFR